MQRSPYTGKPRGLASCVRLSMLCGEIQIQRRHCGETGAQTRATWAQDGYCHNTTVAVYLEDGDIGRATLDEPLEAKNSPMAALVACVSRRDALFSLKILLLFSPSSPCLRACFSTTLAPIHAESLFLHRACLDEHN